MGELYLDDIDKSLKQKYVLCEDGYRLKESAMLTDTARPDADDAQYLFELYANDEYAFMLTS
jgi:hypothetical protein